LLKPNGRFIKKGDPITRTKYGKTLQKIAEAGADEFYSGKMAKQVQLLLIMCIDYKMRYNWLKLVSMSSLPPYGTLSQWPNNP